MSTQYHQVRFDISLKQKKSIASAISSGSSVRLRLSNKQLHGHSSGILATKIQLRQIEKAKEKGTGLIVTLSKKQLENMKSGGFLPVLLGALVSSLAPVLFNKIFPDKNENEGNGINLPGRGINLPGRGINLPGRGVNDSNFINPYNGTDTSYNIEGFSAKNSGNGIVLPGSKSARKYQPKSLDFPEKKNKNLGMGFIDPMASNYKQQLLE